MTKEAILEKLEALDRFDNEIEYGYSDDSWAVMEKYPNGTYVKYEDVVRLLDEDIAKGE